MVRPLHGDGSRSAFSAATSGNSGEDPARTALASVHYPKRNRTGIAEEFGRAAPSTGGFKGEPYGWEVGWSLVTGRFRSLAGN